MSERRPYVRAQPRDWWARKPYLGYTLRELTGVGVVVYGGILLAGLISLAFQTMPKTMPKLIANGRHVPQQKLTLAGVGIAAVCSAALIAAFLIAGALP
jgi:fumarate reductase subunit C